MEVSLLIKGNTEKKNFKVEKLLEEIPDKSHNCLILSEIEFLKALYKISIANCLITKISKN